MKRLLLIYIKQITASILLTHKTDKKDKKNKNIKIEIIFYGIIVCAHHESR